MITYPITPEDTKGGFNIHTSTIYTPTNSDHVTVAGDPIGDPIDPFGTSDIKIKQGKEYVDNPPHYHSKCSNNEMKRIIERINKRGYIEAIDVIDAFFKSNFNLASAFRYMSRLGGKDDELTEINKALWYLEHEKDDITANRTKEMDDIIGNRTK